ncbi:hypothetical protein BJ322DRAFT_1100637 [Thelephora terrestris]|uniref:Uncharacterized protein n=1 Tax=Thelephora terrestris TaxID=56493 RepID=A0A9P6L486_9AGAM|nr:hypothetical protein BJ322DRAFT_1100637 [Thelephora terrestris]
MLGGPSANPFAPFNNQTDWELAKWAKLRGPSSTSFTELMGVTGLCEKLGTSYKNANELNKKIDSLPTRRPKFKRKKVKHAGEEVKFFSRDIIDCIKELYGRHDFVPHLKFKPERHYADADQTIRIYGDMHTGRWWWKIQKAVESRIPGATILPVIISSDKTQVTSFGGKSVYPVYVTIGNIPKDIQRKPSTHAQALLAYLPVSTLDQIDSATSRRRAVPNLFHFCMCYILGPLEQAGKTGVMMKSGDGSTRRCHPILAVFAGDHPEQCLVACTKINECPKGITPPNSLGENEPCDLHDAGDIIDVLGAFDPDEQPEEYNLFCKSAGIKPVVQPFWKSLPYTHIYQALTPDVLHQLHQGVVKHLVGWLVEEFGSAELDARCRTMPPNHNIRHFSKGISKLKRASGNEHAAIGKTLLGLIAGLPLSNGHSPKKLLCATRAILEFLYLAQLPSHNDETLQDLDDALATFHANKSIFIDLGIREDFNLPKLHSLQHYVSSIKLFGTTDNYNTEYSERLHIDLAKDAYAATNHKDELVQMTTWLERKEKIAQFDTIVGWRLLGRPPPLSKPPPRIHRAHIQMTREPVAQVSLDKVVSNYGAKDFSNALATFLAHHENPDASCQALQSIASRVKFNFDNVCVFHKIKLWTQDPQGCAEIEDTLDVIHARCMTTTRTGRKLPARFDTALIKISSGPGEDNYCGVEGYHIGQHTITLNLYGQKHLAYVKWFSPFAHSPEPLHGLHKVSRPLPSALRKSAVVEVSRIHQSIHLFPCFGGPWRSNWNPDTVLESCDMYLVNSFQNRQSYLTVY